MNTLVNRSAIVEMVISSLEDVLAMANGDAPHVDELGEDTRLIGREGLLDSMGLVTLIVDVEQRLEEEYDVALVLADDRAMSQKNSPFRSAGALTNYICQLLEEQG
jgi:acyl carrier protein